MGLAGHLHVGIIKFRFQITNGLRCKGKLSFDPFALLTVRRSHHLVNPPSLICFDQVQGRP